MSAPAWSIPTAGRSPAMAGKVFGRAGALMSAMWHLVVDHDTVGPVFSDVRSEHDGPVVISQDLTVFNVTKESVVARQATVDAYHWPGRRPLQRTGPTDEPAARTPCVVGRRADRRLTATVRPRPWRARGPVTGSACSRWT